MTAVPNFIKMSVVFNSWGIMYLHGLYSAFNGIVLGE